MKCLRCGQKLPEDAQFCLKCGAPVDKLIKLPTAGRTLKLSWTWQPFLMASTDDEELGTAILEQWKQKAHLGHLVDTRTKDGVMYVWYYAEKLGDMLKMRLHKQDALDMYNNTKEYVLVNGWRLAEPEKKSLTGRDEFMALDAEFVYN